MLLNLNVVPKYKCNNFLEKERKGKKKWSKNVMRWQGKDAYWKRIETKKNEVKCTGEGLERGEERRKNFYSNIKICKPMTSSKTEGWNKNRY